MSAPREPLLTIAWAMVDEGGARRTVAWRLAEGLLADAGWPDAALVNPCARCGGAHGAVQLLGAADHVRIGVSYARTEGGVVAVAALARAEPGAALPAFAIDAESMSRDTTGALDLSRPRAAVEWTRIEAALKADGRGLRVDPAAVELSPAAGDGDSGPRWSARVPGRDEPLLGRDLAGRIPGVTVSAAWSPPRP